MEVYEHNPQYGSLKKLQCLDPFTYWLHCKSCLDLREIDEKLKPIVNSQRKNRGETVYSPENGEMVIVQDIDDMFYRGSVLSCLKEGYYSIRLLDKHGTLTVGEDEIYFLPSPWKYIKEQGHIVRIYGAIPSLQLNLELERKWDHILNRALSDAGEIQLDNCCEIEDFIFGSIVLLNGSHKIRLSKLLFEIQFAVPSHDFEKDIITFWKHKKKKDTANLHCNHSMSTSRSSIAEKSETMHSSQIEENSDIKISPQHNLFLKALTEGFILSPESLLHPNTSGKESFSEKRSSDYEQHQSGNPELTILSEKSPDLIYKNSFHDRNAPTRESAQKSAYSTESCSQEYTMPDKLTGNYLTKILSSDSTYLEKGLKSTFDMVGDNEGVQEGSTFKIKSKSKNAKHKSHLEERKPEGHNLKNIIFEEKNDRLISSRKINNSGIKQTTIKSKTSHRGSDSSDKSDSFSNKLTDRSQKQEKRLKNERISESKPFQQEVRLHLKADMFLSDNTMFSSDSSVSSANERENIQRDPLQRSSNEHSHSFSSQNLVKKKTRGSISNSESPNSSVTNFSRSSTGNQKSKDFEQLNDNYVMHCPQKSVNSHNPKEENTYRPDTDFYHSTPCSEKNLERKNIESHQNASYRTDNLSPTDRLGNNSKETCRGVSRSRGFSAFLSQKSNSINRRDLDNSDSPEISAQHGEKYSVAKQQNLLKHSDKARTHHGFSSTDSKNCTSTPKQHPEKESANEIEISPIYNHLRQHLLTERRTEEKHDLTSLLSGARDSEVYKQSFQDYIPPKEKNEVSSLLKSNKFDNTGTDTSDGDVTSKLNDSPSLHLSLKDKVSRISFEPKYSGLSGGMGRGKLLQMYNESRANDKPTNSAENLQSTADSDLFVSCNENLIDPTTKEELSDLQKCITKTNLPLQSESEIKTVIPEERNIEDNAPEEEPAGYIANEHEDRYYDIEPPKLLTYPIDEASLYASEDSKMESKKTNPEEVYENLLNEVSEHEPVDSSALINSVQKSTLKLEQEILREYSIGELTERMKFLCGIIHGNIKSQPISNISELKLHSHIFANMAAKKVKDLTRSQMCAIPVLLQRRNLILVGPPNSGKTLAYVISILSLLLDEDYYKTIRKGNGPRCVFVTSSSQNANYISQFCSAMCGAKLTIITTYGGGLELERKVELSNGCEVLVTTPKCWLRLLQHTSVTNLFRLCHVVFDDADILLDTFLPDVQEIMNLTKKMLLIRRRECSLGLHVAIVGEKWTPILEDVLKAMESPVLCISSHLEAALYARVKPTTHILLSGAKIEKLKVLLQSNTKKLRTVIVCQCAAEVKALRTIIDLSTSDDFLVAHEEMSLTLVCEVSAKWAKSISPPTLLCSDLILGEVAIANAQRLIHFSIPESKAYFSERFATIKENYYDRIKYPKSAPPDCQVDILVDDSNEQQFPEIVDFMKRLSTPISNEVMATVKKINIQREKRKADMMLCKRILMFGRCWKMERCKKRHVFKNSKDNEKPQLPQNGMVKVKILYVHNPSHYSVRIIATKANQNDPWENKKSNFLILGLKMANYYSHRENRIPHGRVNVGDIVAVQIESDLLFRRGKVLEIISRDEKLNPVLVNVHLIDKGSIQKCKAIDLLHLPPELQNIEQESFDLYLTGLQPVDFDNEWSFAAIYRLKKSIESFSANEDDQFFVAKIILTAGTNMITNSLLCYEWLELNKCFIVRFSPRKFILDTGFAEPNNGHVRAILDLAIEGGLISSYPKNLSKLGDEDNKEGEEIQWAHLEKEKYFLTSVISSVNPSLFYLKVNKFSDRLLILHQELTKLLNKKIIKPDLIRVDMLCAVRNPVDNEWNRAMVLEILDDQEIEVFCVDYGDIITVPFSDFSLLPKGFVSRLPFQAVECSLVGIVPLDDDWTPEAIQFFYMVTGDEENILRPLYAKVCEIDLKAETTGGRHYQIVLVDTSKDQDTVVNKELVYKGYANWDPVTKVHLTDPIRLSSNCENATDECNEGTEEDNDDNDKATNDNNEEWSDEVCLKEEDEMTPKKTPKAISCSEEERIVLDDFLRIIKNGEFDFEITTRGLIEQTFFPQNQLALDRGLPCPSDSGTESTKIYDPDCVEEPPAQTEEKESIPKDKSVVIKSDLPNQEGIKPGHESESDNKSTFVQESFCATPLLKVFDSIFYPPVLWSQNDFHVRLRVNIPDLTKYHLNYDEFQLHFLAHIEQKYYWFDLKFFGPIHTDSVLSSQKGQYLEIKVEKYVKGESWPRLSYENIKHSWIKLDPEFIFKQDDENEETLVDTLIKRGERLKNYKQNLHSKESILKNIATNLGPDMDSDLESEGSGSSDAEEYYDLREPEEDETGDH